MSRVDDETAGGGANDGNAISVFLSSFGLVPFSFRLLDTRSSLNVFAHLKLLLNISDAHELGDGAWEIPGKRQEDFQTNSLSFSSFVL